MKKIILFVFLSAVCFSCTKETDCDPVRPNGSDQIAISAEIINADIHSRTGYTGSSAVWANNDSLGLFCQQSKAAAVNLRFLLSGVGSTPVWTPATPIYWADASTFHKFLGYVPYASGNNDPTAVKLPALTPQNGTINPAKDFLISNNQYATGVQRSGSAVPLNFTHALALIQFDITIGNSITASTVLNNLVLAAGPTAKLINTDGTSTINLSSGAISPSASATTNTITVTPASAPTLSGTAVTLYVLILPGTYTAPTLQLNLTEPVTGAIAVPAKPLATTTFAANTKYTYSVNVTRTALTISTPTITDWTPVSGGNINPGI